MLVTFTNAEIVALVRRDSELGIGEDGDDIGGPLPKVREQPSGFCSLLEQTFPMSRQ